MKSYVFPGNIDELVMKIGSEPIPYMRTAEFSKMNLESEQMLLSLIGCKDGRTIVYTGSGTGGMDAVVANYVTTKMKAFIIDGGSFGHRWVELCKYYQCNHCVYSIPFASEIDYVKLETEVREQQPDVFLCQHHETSSGQLFNIKKISEICERYHISLVVDVISSFLAEELNMDDLNIDICITSTQKGLNIPPGLSIIFFSKNIVDYPFTHNSYYFDFQENLRNLKRGQTPFSPATTIFLQLNMRLHQIMKYGKDNIIEDVKHRAKLFRSLCVKYHWEIPAETPSAAITGFFVNSNGDKIFHQLIEEYNIFIMPGSRENFFRVSHMGIQGDDDLKELAELIHNIEETIC